VRPRILWATTDLFWVWGNLASYLTQQLKQWYNIIVWDWKTTQGKIPDENFDLVYSQNREWFYTDTKLENKVVCNIGSHRSFSNLDEIQLKKEMLKFRAVGVLTKRLEKIFKKYHSHVFWTPNGVNTTLFKPITRPANNGLVVGWAGADDSESKDYRTKNYREVVVPACKEAGVKLLVAEQKTSFRPHYKMPEFYNALDIYAHPSNDEGSSNSILEALACGVPVIATDVGAISELIDSGCRIMICQPTVESLVNCIKKLRADSTLRNQMSCWSRNTIVKKWTWSTIAIMYKEMFDFALDN